MSIARQRRRQRRRASGQGERVEWALEPADTAAVHRLRHQIMQTLGRIATPDADLSAAAIVVAELLTNALAHASGQAWVSLRWDGTHPLLSVADQGPGFGPNSTRNRGQDDRSNDGGEAGSNDGQNDGSAGGGKAGSN